MRCLAFVKLRSSFCLNLGREHLSNTVYLEIDGRSRLCYQKCFCRCDTVEGRLGRAADGRAVRCRDFRSAPVRATRAAGGAVPRAARRRQPLRAAGPLRAHVTAAAAARVFF